MLHQNNINKVFVARDCDRTAGLTAGNLTTNLAHGEIVIVDQDGAIVNTAALVTAATSFRIMQGVADEPPYMSDVIRKKDIVSIKSSIFEQRQEEKVFIGYNMTSGSIEVISANVYALTVDGIYKNPNDPSAFTTMASYESALSGATQYKIARGIAQVLGKAYAQFTHGVRVNIVSTSAVDALQTVVGCEVIEGDSVLSYTSLQGTTPAIGTVLAIPGITGGDHRDETTTLYEIVYIDIVNKIVELDRPYTNRSQSAIDIEQVTDITTGDFGISLEGVSPVPISVGEEVIFSNFTVTTSGFGDTIETSGTTALAFKQGFGRGDMVANAEFWHQGGGSERGKYQDREFQNTIQETIRANGYSMVKIEFEHNERLGTLETNGQKKSVSVYLDRNTQALIAANDAATAFGTNIQTATGVTADMGTTAGSFLNVLNAFGVGAEVLTAGVNTVANGGGEITAGITQFSNGIDV